MSARHVVVSDAAGHPPVGRGDDDHVAFADRASGLSDATSIVGRMPELERLHGIRDAAFDGGFGCALVGGEAGVGKTSLVNAAAAIADRDVAGLTIARGECVPLGGEGLPYAPVVGLLHDLAHRFTEATLLEWAGAGAAELCWLIPEFGDPQEPVDAGGAQTRLRLFETIAGLIEEAARRAPLLIVIEDLHWADDSSRHLIEFLLRAIGPVPVMLILTYRTDELTRRHPLRPFLAELGRLPVVTRVEVGPLGAAEVEQLITSGSAALGVADEQRSLIKRVVRASGGIPYFAVELARASSSVGSDLPETLRDTLLLRVSRVGEECQRLLRLLAIGGNRVEHDLIAAVAELPAGELESTLREAVEANLLIPDSSGYAFRHALMREVLDDDLLPGERTRMHRAYAPSLEGMSVGPTLPESVRAVELARHWYAARDNAEALRWSVAAARLQRYGFSEALRLYERALELHEVVPDADRIAAPLLTLLDEAASSAADAGEPERALALLDEALRLTDEETDPLTAADRLSEKSRVLQNLMQPGALETVDRALSLVPREPPTRRLADVLTMRAARLLLLHKPASIEAAREAIVAARQVDAIGLEAHARNTLGSALIVLDVDPEQGWTELDQAGALSPVSDNVRLRHSINCSDTLYQTGRYRESFDVAVRARDVAGRLGQERRSGVMLAGNAAEAAMALGDWSRARELVEWALKLSPPGNHWVHQRRLLASILLWVDDDADAAAEILCEISAHSQLAATGPQYFAALQQSLAEVALANGDPVGAWDIERRTLDTLPWAELGHDLPALGVAAMAYGRADGRPADWAPWLRQRMIFRDTLPITRQWASYIEAELRASTQQWTSAIATMRAAAAPPHMIGYATLRSAASQLADGQHDEARRSAQVARELADRMGLRLLQRWVVEFCDAAFADDPKGVRSGDSPQPDVGGGLTPREQEVLTLVADGLSNRQIGQQLVISTKTASVHVSNILAKLGVGSRGEAAAVFRAGRP
ncbi:helix-turn-helix transcriptional regulator [Microlunatus soli]|nr:LuxR family transcriptional regulator [Microlunatus soli]